MKKLSTILFVSTLYLTACNSGTTEEETSRSSNAHNEAAHDHGAHGHEHGHEHGAHGHEHDHQQEDFVVEGDSTTITEEQTHDH